METNTLIGVFVLFQTWMFYQIQSYFRIIGQKKAYILSTHSSFVLSLYSLYYYTFPSYSIHYLIICYFQAHLITDLLVGFIEYNQAIWKLEGVYHHLAYILINIMSFYYPTYLDIYLFYMIEEIPTFIRSFGYIFPKYRSNFLFGFTMITLRIGLHSYLLWYYFFQGFIVSSLSFCSLTLHVYWTKNWITHYVLKKLN